jgi:hypothetical protein
MWHANRKKKIVITVIVAIVILATVGYLIWQRKPAISHQIAQTCSDYGPMADYFDGPASFQEMANGSVAIVVATAEDPDVLGKSLYPGTPEPKIKVKEVLKGNVRVNDILSVCAGMGYIDLQAGDHPAIVLFAENKDGNNWIPAWGSDGIVPQKENGRFEMNALGEDPKSVALDELRKIVKQ